MNVKVSFQDIYTSEHTTLNIPVKMESSVTDIALRKAIVLTHFVDLQNEYIFSKKGVKHLERFQSFRRHITQELEELGDKSLASNNLGNTFFFDFCSIIDVFEKKCFSLS